VDEVHQSSDLVFEKHVVLGRQPYACPEEQV